MSELVANCPRCNATRMTFHVLCHIPTGKYQAEAFCICRACARSTVFVLSLKDTDLVKLFEQIESLPRAVNQIAEVRGHITLRDMASQNPPEYLPVNVEAAFREGATCLAVGCPNAAGTMFRLCLDLATRDMLPTEDVEGLNARTRRDLGLRLPWLFDNGQLPEALRELSSCIKDEGNDGAHQGTLTEGDALDILDFTYALLERLYSEPKRLALAKERRDKRRSKK